MSGISIANQETPVEHGSKKRETLSAQVQLLYSSANVTVGVTVLAATILAYLESMAGLRAEVLCWWIYVIIVALVRYVLALRYRRAAPSYAEIDKWRAAFAAGAGLAGIGWGAAGVLLFQKAELSSQLFLIFVIGGMMLGAASLLAPRPEAFLAFLIPTGLVPTARLLVEFDETHVAMGILAGVFTLATVIMTARIHRTIDSSLALQFENRELVSDLHAAKGRVEELNRVLERRVQERTTELERSTEHLRDEIAQRKRMEEELLRVRKLESLGVLAGGIAHDFNNFLTVVQGNIELAKARLAPESAVQEILDQAAGTCRRAAFLSSQLLTFAKGGAPVRRVVSVARLVTEAVQLVRAGAPVSIVVTIAEDLYPAEVDPIQIGQVLHNILLNARQSMPDAGIVEVSVRNVLSPNGVEGDLRVRISIRDFGCGISPDVLPRIFDPYFTTKPGGNGLGLATAYAIVAKHNGRVSVESTPGEGTLVTVELPACRKSLAPEPPPAVECQPGRERILVMDDEEALRNLLHTVLTGFGYEVETAADGAEAITVYESAKSAGLRFDAVLLDLTVSGGMGGIEAAARLKEIDPVCKLIVSSGYSADPVMSEYSKYGFDAVLPKPWRTAELSQILRKVLAVEPDLQRD